MAYSDSELRDLARKRVAFRSLIVVYGITIGSLWCYLAADLQRIPLVCMVTMAGWSIAVVFRYLFDYRFFRLFSEESEFEKLRERKLHHGEQYETLQFPE